jgi:IS605 OrfB family transposase
LIGDVCVRLAERARIAGKPLVIEKLDFRKKKAELEGESRKQARMLSSFACNQTLSGLKSACFRARVEVIEVNPTFASVIGAVNYAATRGLSTHQAAAIAIARRGLELRESPAVRGVATVPVRNGGHVAFALPARNRAKHVWL